MWLTSEWTILTIYLADIGVLCHQNCWPCLRKLTWHCKKYRNFTWFSGVEILWKGTKKLGKITVLFTLWRAKLDIMESDEYSAAPIYIISQIIPFWSILPGLSSNYSCVNSFLCQSASCCTFKVDYLLKKQIFSCFFLQFVWLLKQF